MRAQAWTQTGGIRWVHPVPQPTDEPPSGLSAFVALGRGHAHQSVARWGSADATAQVLQRALRRPVETSGQVHEVEAQVEVSMFHTAVTLSGPVAAVRHRLRWLDETLHDPAGLDLEPSPRGRDHLLKGWGRELGLWWGVTPATLSADVNPPWTGSPEVLAETLRALHPDQGCPVVIAVSDIVGVGSAFAETVTTPLTPDPAGVVWHDVGPASVVTPYVNHLLTARSTATVAGEVAANVFLATLQRALAVTGGTAGIRTVAPRFGDSRWLAVTAAPAEDTEYDESAVASAVLSAIELSRDGADDTVATMVEQWRSDERMAYGPPLSGLATVGLLTGTRPTSEDHRAQLEALDPPRVRAELELLHRRMLLGLPSADHALASHPLVEREPVPVGSIRQGLSVHQSSFAMPMSDGVPRRVSITRRGSTLESEASGSSGHGRRPEPVTSRLDLSRTVARVDVGDPGYSILIDDRDNRLEVPWPALSRRRRLEKTVAAAIPEERRIRLPGDPRLAQALRVNARKARRILISVGVFLALVFGLILVVNLTTEPDDPVTTTTVTAGTEVTLGNGARIRLADPRLISTIPSRPQVVADVQLCGGRLEEGRSDQRYRNTSSAYAFALLGTAGGVAGPQDGQPLASVTVPDDSCVAGAIAFEVAPGTTVEGLSVLYTNSADDAVTWTL